MDWHETGRVEKSESKIRKYHDPKLQTTQGTVRTNLRHREEELQDIYSNNTSKKKIKPKQPASSSRWLQN